ncbi:MAG: hypothetical protein ACE14L_05165 [Terriglobales bacterium]
MSDLALLLGGFVIGLLLQLPDVARKAESWFSRLANRRAWAVLICAGVATLPRLALLPWLPPPEPAIQDEFSYVLGAQTFAAGRLTNPTPAFWQHFESFHINMVPSYQSMYPPAPSLFYALGIVVGGNPWWGVWLATGLMCAAICWALQPLVRPRYALLAGLLCALKYGMFTIFSDSFWGGSVAALGGAVTLGAFVRLIAGPRLWHVSLMVLGLGVLANSRPFEGLLFALPVLIATLVWMLKKRHCEVLVSATGLLALLFAGMGYYNLRGTGHVFEMPYVANFKQYHYVRPFLGAGELPRPQYRHVAMATLYDQWEGEVGRLGQSASGVLALIKQKFRFYYQRHFAPLLMLALAGTAVAFRSRMRILAYTFLLVAVGLFSEVWWPGSAHAAPLLVSFFGLAMLGIRYVRCAFRANRRVGLMWARGLMAGLLLFGIGTMTSNAIRGLEKTVAFPLPWNQERTRIIHHLERRGGEHLVFVRYFRDHPIHQEWVYNSPDIDKQPVILARMMGRTEDCRLIQHYAGRQVWLLEPDVAKYPTALVPLETTPLAPGCAARAGVN